MAGSTLGRGLFGIHRNKWELAKSIRIFLLFLLVVLNTKLSSQFGAVISTRSKPYVVAFSFLLSFVIRESNEWPAPRCGTDSLQVIRHAGKCNKYTPRLGLCWFASTLLQRYRKGFETSRWLVCVTARILLPNHILRQRIAELAPDRLFQSVGNTSPLFHNSLVFVLWTCF